MLSKINPMGESGRGHRYAVTAAWFVAGAVVGGVTLGAGAALFAVAWGALDLSSTAALGTGALLALAAALLDTRILGFGPPFHRRQVNDTWLGRYRSGVYALSFGWQLGVGVSTYIMTTAVFLTAALGALTGRPLAALAIGATYGLARGLMLLVGARASSPAALRRVLAGFEAWNERVRRAALAVQFTVAAVAPWLVWGPIAAMAVVLVECTAGLWAARAERVSTPSPSEPASTAGPTAPALTHVRGG